MSDLRATSKRLSWLLRHGAASEGLAVDAAGWVAVSDVCRHLEITESELDAVVEQNDKRRLQRQGDRIRCSQGHSAHLPVTLDALEASWQPYRGEAPVVHGTTVEAAREIFATGGIRPMGRTHVHLAADADAKVGKRASVAVVLDIDPSRAGPLWMSPNGVILARMIPISSIVGVRGMTRRGRKAEEALRTCLQASRGHHESP